MFVLAVVNLLSIIFAWYKVFRPKTHGEIIMMDEANMYLELKDDTSLSDIYASEYAVFKVKRKSQK